MSKTRCLIHIVFATKSRKRTIPEEHKRELYAYLYGILKNNKCFLHRMNGIPDHIHMLIDLHPMIALGDLIKELKLSSNKWMKQNPKFSDFECWGSGYYAVSVGVEGLDACKRYIIGQDVHHRGEDFMIEMEFMARRHGLTWYEDDWN